MKHFILFFIVFIGWIYATTLVGERAPIAISRDSKSRISELKMGWPKFVKSSKDFGEGAVRYYVMIRGEYQRKHWRLYWNQKPIEIKANRKLTLRIPIQSRVVKVQLVAVGPRGESETETINVYVLDWEKVLQTSRYGRPYFEVIPHFGVGHYSLEQTDQSNFSEILINSKLLFNWAVAPPNWSIHAHLDASLFAFGGTNNNTVRLLNIDIVGGYTFFLGESGFSISVLSGGQYKTTFVTDDRFGYFNLAGPQLRTEAQYKFQNGDSFSLFIKLGPVVRDGRLLSFSNFEFATGLGPTFLLKDGHVLPIILDLSFLRLDVDGGLANTFAVTMWFGYSIF